MTFVGCGDGDDPPNVTASPGAVNLAKGKKSTITARVDGRAATSAVTWRSGNNSIATVVEGTGGSAEITAVGVGQTTVTVTQDEGSATVNVTVVAASIESLAIMPTAPMVTAGATADLTATATLSDGTTSNVTSMVTWTSSDATKATVSAAGQLRGVAVGTATLTATLGDKTATAAATVTAATLTSIAVTPATATRIVGQTQQFVATGTFSDATTADITTSVTWSSSNAAQASISNAAGSNGLATALAAGTPTITATLGAITGAATLTVNAVTLVSIAVTPATATRPVGLTQQFVATGTYSDATTAVITTTVTWSSSSAAIATISNTAGSNGLATAVAPGNATITATLGAITGTATLTVNAVTLVSIAVAPATATIAAGTTQQYIATGTYNDNSTADITAMATWTSSDETHATISSTGLATGVAAGATTITAALDGITGTAALEVGPAVIASIAVAPATMTIDVDQTQQYTATATYTDGTTSDVSATATWNSSNTGTATISATGLATGISAGTVTISAAQGGVTGTAALTVRALMSIAITPAGDLAPGTSRQLVATATFTDASTVVVTELATWTSGNTAGVTVSDAAGTKGLATGVSQAGATISATVGAITGTLAIAGCNIVVNEVQVAGANAAGVQAAANEWIELASKCTAEQNLTGLRLVYRAAAASSVESVVLELTGTLAAGGYNFYAHAAAAVLYPTATATFGSGTTGSLGGAGGGVGLRVSVTGGSLLDSMGYGTAANALIEGTVFGAITSGSSAARTPDKADTNNNAADFALDATTTPGAANN